MPTRFTSLGISGALVVGGAVTMGVVAITTLTATTGNFTNTNVSGTAEATTMSGTTFHDTASQWLVSGGNSRAVTTEADTLSGITLRTSANGTNITDARVKALILTGGQLWANGGTSGAVLCFKTTGQIGKCSDAVYGAGVCNCQ